MDKCDYLAYYLHFQKNKWICYAPPFLQPFLRFYDSPSIVDARDNSLRVVLSLDRGDRTEIINADLGEFHSSEDHSFFQFMTDGEYVEFQKSLQSGDDLEACGFTDVPKIDRVFGRCELERISRTGILDASVVFFVVLSGIV